MLLDEGVLSFFQGFAPAFIPFEAPFKLVLPPICMFCRRFALTGVLPVL